MEGEISTETTIIYRIPKGFVLGLLLFLIYIYIYNIYIYMYIYINDLNEAILHSLIHHFADDASMLVCSPLLKKTNKYINHDLSQIVQWLRANRISLNAKPKSSYFEQRLKTLLKILTSE